MHSIKQKAGSKPAFNISARDQRFGVVALLPSLLFFGWGRVESLGLGFAPLSEEPVPARLLSLPDPDAAVVGLFCLSTALFPVLVLLLPAGVLAGLPLVPSSFEDWPAGFAWEALVLLQAKLAPSNAIIRAKDNLFILPSGNPADGRSLDGMDRDGSQDASFLMHAG